MKILYNILLVILVFLATSSGITKILLMQQDVEFFGEFGFSNAILVTYGAFQLVGGILLIISKTRFAGALIVAITFIISAIVLIMAGKILVAIITFVTIIMLGVIMKQCINDINASKSEG